MEEKHNKDGKGITPGCTCEHCLCETAVEAVMTYTENHGRPANQTGLDHAAEQMFEKKGIKWFDLSREDRRQVVGSVLITFCEDPERIRKEVDAMKAVEGILGGSDKAHGLIAKLFEKFLGGEGVLPDSMEAIDTARGKVIGPKGHPIMEEIKRTGVVPDDLDVLHLNHKDGDEQQSKPSYASDEQIDEQIAESIKRARGARGASQN